MKTNGRIDLSKFDCEADRGGLQAIIDSFPVTLKVEPPESQIWVDTYDAGKQNSFNQHFYIYLIPNSRISSCDELQNLDRERYTLSFESCFGRSTKLIIRDIQERYTLEISSCQGE
jgi:hypothetical protein